jgi:hypothetical protein
MRTPAAVNHLLLSDNHVPMPGLRDFLAAILSQGSMARAVPSFVGEASCVKTSCRKSDCLGCDG